MARGNWLGAQVRGRTSYPAGLPFCQLPLTFYSPFHVSISNAVGGQPVHSASEKCRQL